MNEFIKLLLLNPGKTAGIVLGFVLALFLIFIGIFKTLFIAGLVVLGYILGKWHDEGVSFKRFLKNIVDSFRDNKWK